MDNETVERVARALYETLYPKSSPLGCCSWEDVPNKDGLRNAACAALAAAEPAIRADQIKMDAALVRELREDELVAEAIESQNNE